jgi:hypothetical protein
MVDQGRFINTYIDTIINSLLEYVKSNLQLQTQVKVGEFAIAEKDQIIASLQQQLDENKIAEDWRIKYEASEINNTAMQNKLSHMETLLNQVSDMKRIIHEKNAEIAKLKSPKKVINTKAKKKEEPSVVVQETKQEKTDDF